MAISRKPVSTLGYQVATFEQLQVANSVKQVTTSEKYVTTYENGVSISEPQVQVAIFDKHV